MENQLDNVFDLQIDQRAREEMTTLSTWAKITAMVAFISYGVGLISTFIGTPAASPLGKAGQVVGYLVVAAIGVAINYYLYQFAVKCKSALDSENQVELDQSWNHLRTYFKILGILFIIALGLMVLAILFAGLGSLTA